MAASSKPDELLRLMRQREQAFAKGDRNGGIAGAVHNEEWNSDVADALIGTKLIQHQPTDRYDRHQRTGEFDRRRIGRLENQFANEMLRRQRFRERHAVWWLLAAIVSLLVSIFPDTLQFAATAVGVEIPSNLAFFVSVILLVIVSVQHSSELTRLEEKTRILAEHVALLEQRVALRDTGSGSGTGTPKRPEDGRADRGL